MKLSEISIRRPVLAWVMSIVITLFGAIAFTRLPVRQYPDIDPPIVSVTTIYPGANPRVVETEVTEVLEEQVNGIEGIKSLTSQSEEQVSRITVEFNLRRNIDVASQDVRDRVLRARNRLPQDIEEPIIAKRDADANVIVWLSLAGENYNALELTDMAENKLKDRLQTLPGVATVIIGGERRWAMRIWLEARRMAAHGLTIVDVEEALRRENVEIPSGRIEGRMREFSVRTEGQMKTPEEFAAMIVAHRGGKAVRIRDIGRAEIGPEDERKLVRVNGKPAIGLGVIKQSKANTLRVAQAVKDQMEILKRDLPKDVEFIVAYDSSIFIDRSIKDVRRTLAIAGILVVLIIFVFLRSVRATFIPAITIPVAVIGSFLLLYLADFTINILTLMALALAIGLVVDDAIIVVENTYRRIEEGEAPMQAGIRGMHEIAFAVIATTVALVAVFTPLAFLTGSTGQLFREFGIALAGAVVISTFVALTLTPMLCTRILKPVEGKRRKLDAEGRKRRGSITRLYAGFLRAALWSWPLVIGLAVLAALWSVVLYGKIGQELLATEDRGSIFVITSAPEGSTMDYTDRFQRQAEEIMMEVPEIDRVVSVIALGIGTPGAVNRGALFSMLVPWEERERSQMDVVAEIQPKLLGIPGILAFAFSPPPLGQSYLSSPVQFVIQGPDIEKLGEVNARILARAQAIPGAVNVDSDLKLNKPELLVEIDRERAGDLGVSVRQIARSLQVLLGGEDLSRFKRGSEQYDVIVQLEEGSRVRPEDVSELYIRTRSGDLVQLTSLLKTREAIGPRSLNHYNRIRSATIRANVLPGYPLRNVLDEFQRIADEELPRGYRTDLGGQSREFAEASTSIRFAFFLAIAVIYLALAAQFESFLHPFTVLMTVPLAITGALFALVATGTTLNIASEIGIIMLIGLAAKNGILIVEFCNQKRAQGMALVDAIVEAATIRFRPIVMTALSTSLGILPIAVGYGAGGESRSPMAIAVIGGLLFSTVLTLVVIPVVYLLLARLRSLVWESEESFISARHAG